MIMPFSMNNAPAMFQRLVNPMLSVFLGGEAYLGDSEVYSKLWHEPRSVAIHGV